jgi:hypothetical protein
LWTAICDWQVVSQQRWEDMQAGPTDCRLPDRPFRRPAETETATRRSPPFLIIFIRQTNNVTRRPPFQRKTNISYLQIKFIEITPISFALLSRRDLPLPTLSPACIAFLNLYGPTYDYCRRPFRVDEAHQRHDRARPLPASPSTYPPLSAPIGMYACR